jgi:hypothetical protein
MPHVVPPFSCVARDSESTCLRQVCVYRDTSGTVVGYEDERGVVRSAATAAPLGRAAITTAAVLSLSCAHPLSNLYIDPSTTALLSADGTVRATRPAPARAGGGGKTAAVVTSRTSATAGGALHDEESGQLVGSTAEMVSAGLAVVSVDGRAIADVAADGTVHVCTGAPSTPHHGRLVVHMPLTATAPRNWQVNETRCACRQDDRLRGHRRRRAQPTRRCMRLRVDEPCRA